MRCRTVSSSSVTLRSLISSYTAPVCRSLHTRLLATRERWTQERSLRYRDETTQT